MCVYIYITYEIKKCVYNKKACVYVFMRDCLDKYIKVATWPLQIKISDFAPTHMDGKKYERIPKLASYFFCFPLVKKAVVNKYLILKI